EQTGKWIPLEDGKKDKDFEQRLNSSDLVETLSDAYPSDLPSDSWKTNFDPGRYRNTEFLKAVYGDSPDEVRSNLVAVKFAGTSFLFNRQNGAAEAFARAGKKLDRLIKEKPKLKKYLEKIGGSFNWRNIAN